MSGTTKALGLSEVKRGIYDLATERPPVCKRNRGPLCRSKVRRQSIEFLPQVWSIGCASTLMKDKQVLCLFEGVRDQSVEINKKTPVGLVFTGGSEAHGCLLYIIYPHIFNPICTLAAFFFKCYCEED